MSTNRYYPSSAQFGSTGLWWVTGGFDGLNTLDTTEIYNSTSMDFEDYVTLPRPMEAHNVVNVNDTHMVVVGGADREDNDASEANDLYMLNRYVVRSRCIKALLSLYFSQTYLYQ